MAKKTRVSISKTQRQTSVGAELLDLCQSIAGDGRLSNEEIKQLIRWLRDHRHEDLPAVQYLFDIVEEIVADKVVTPEEKRELHLAIEKVLPPDVRAEGLKQRKEIDAKKKEIEKQKESELRVREERELKRNRPIRTRNFVVENVDAFESTIREMVKVGNAVRLCVGTSGGVDVRLSDGRPIGQVPDDIAVLFAPLLRDGSKAVAHVTKLLVKGRVPRPIVDATIYRSDADSDVIRLASKPKNPPSIFDWKFEVAGVRFSNEEGSSREQIVSELEIGQALRLHLDNQNPYDSNAIKVCDLRNHQLGFMPRNMAAEARQYLEQRHSLFAWLVDNRRGYNHQWTPQGIRNIETPVAFVVVAKESVNRHEINDYLGKHCRAENIECNMANALKYLN